MLAVLLKEDFFAPFRLAINRHDYSDLIEAETSVDHGVIL